MAKAINKKEKLIMIYPISSSAIKSPCGLNWVNNEIPSVSPKQQTLLNNRNLNKIIDNQNQGRNNRKQYSNLAEYFF
ncbi:MAG: hypothetical protein MZV64_70320 [Ignavibacteriales bacterium]|nr:hypothetical protein [Ignavibacteriales bacterium]